MSFFCRNMHPVIWFARFRSGVVAAVAAQRLILYTWSSSIEGSISLRQWSVWYVHLLPPPPPFSIAEILCC